MTKLHIIHHHDMGYALFDYKYIAFDQQITKWYARLGYLYHIMHTKMFPHMSDNQFKEFVQTIDIKEW